MGRGPVCGMMTRRTGGAGRSGGLRPVLRLRAAAAGASAAGERQRLGQLVRRATAWRQRRRAGARQRLQPRVPAGGAGLATGGTATAELCRSRSGHRWTCDHRADGRLARDGRGRWRSDDVGLRTRLRDDAAGRLAGATVCVRAESEAVAAAGGWRQPAALGAGVGDAVTDGRRRNDGRRARRARLWLRPRPACARGWPSVRRRAWRPWRGRTSACCRPLPARRAAFAAVLEVLPDPFGLVGFDGAGVGLSRHADCFERVQNWPALYFQFPCQIVDSNFAHPSLFALLPAPLAVHISLIEGWNLYCKCYP